MNLWYFICRHVLKLSVTVSGTVFNPFANIQFIVLPEELDAMFFSLI